MIGQAESKNWNFDGPEDCHYPGVTTKAYMIAFPAKRISQLLPNTSVLVRISKAASDHESYTLSDSTFIGKTCKGKVQSRKEKKLGKIHIQPKSIFFFLSALTRSFGK